MSRTVKETEGSDLNHDNGEFPKPGNGATEGAYRLGDNTLNFEHDWQSDIITYAGRRYHAERPRDREVEILISGRLDLMVAAGEMVNRLTAWRFMDPDGVAGVADSAAELIERLAAYIVGGDARLIRAGDEIDDLRSRFNQSIVDFNETMSVGREKMEGMQRQLDQYAQHSEATEKYCRPAIDLLKRISAWTNTEADFADGYQIRKIARRVFAGEPATLPAVYSEEDRKRARDAVFAKYYNPNKSIKQTISTNTGEIVDTVAEALGLRRAGE